MSKNEYFQKRLNYSLKENQKFKAVCPKNNEELFNREKKQNSINEKVILCSEYIEMPADLVYKILKQLKANQENPMLKSDFEIDCTMNLDYSGFLQATNTNKKK